QGQSNRVLLTDTPLEALSLAVQDRRQAGTGTIYLAESPKDLPEDLAEFAHRGGTVYAAYENSPTGEQQAWELVRRIPQLQRRQPEQGNWQGNLLNNAQPIDIQAWQRIAKALEHSDGYLAKIEATRGQPLSKEASVAMQRDMQGFQQLQDRLWTWHQNARLSNASPDYLNRIAEVAIAFNGKEPEPLSGQAKTAMNQSIAAYTNRKVPLPEVELAS
ncbi:MAG: hypothetical protein WCD18_24845, partial [Thermosynechococcaceae cyanobacterium]